MLYSSYQNRAQQQKEETEDAKTKKVLVLPFYKMTIVEESRLNSLRALLSSSPDPGSQNVEMSVDECVRLIHQAAADPQIVALYGIMGHGHNFSTGGWAHVEEIRNALVVFSQAHRRHYEPGQPETAKDAPKKPMYLYTNTFAAPTPSGGADMKDYYLASVFSHIHLQSQGDLNLMGLHTTNTFYRDFLAKYGITVHVWKHGQFKNFANQFTHSQYNQPHAENVFNILRGIQQHVLGKLFESRYEKFKEYQPHNFWPMVLNAGSLPATVAQQIGFIDYLAPRNPLDDLVDYQTKTTNTNKEALQEKWQNKTGGESGTELVPLTDLEGFAGTKPITIMEYARKFKQQEQRKEQMWQVYERMQKLSSGMQSILGLFGMSAPYFNFEKVSYRQRLQCNVVTFIHSQLTPDRLSIYTTEGLQSSRSQRTVRTDCRVEDFRPDYGCNSSETRATLASTQAIIYGTRGGNPCGFARWGDYSLRNHSSTASRLAAKGCGKLRKCIRIWWVLY
jgi:hypothetical protein